MSFFRITLHRSAIGLPQRTHGVLAALGLRKRNQTVFHPVSPQFAGMIMKVKELVRVDEVDRADEALEADLKKIEGAGVHLLGLINDILDLSKVEAGKMEVNAATLHTHELADYVDRAFTSVAQERGLRFDDPWFSAKWPVPPAEVSAKDGSWPAFDPSYHAVESLRGLR